MRVDRTLIGVILIALVLSTVVTAFIVGEKGEYSLVKNIRPKRVQHSTGRRYSFGLTMITKDDVGSLRISHYCLVNRTDVIENLPKEIAPEEAALMIPTLKPYMQATDQDPSLREVGVHEVKIGKKRYELHLYDFSKLVWTAVPEGIMRSTERPRAGIGFLWDYYDVFGILYDEVGQLSMFYQGVADFFVSKVVTIKELFIEMNEEKKAYYGVTEEGESQGPASSILSAPARGVLLFQDLKRNDRIGVLFQVDGGAVPNNKGILHITAISVDEGEPDYIFSPM